jgi:homoserine dehydrogenase
VDDVFNAILVRGNFLGDIMFYGKGAGKLPTASAVVSDVVDAVKHRETNVMTIWNSRKLELAELDTLENKFFVRVPESEKQKAQQLFAVEREVRAEGIEGEYAFFTRPMTEGDFALAAAKTEVISRIRAEI